MYVEIYSHKIYEVYRLYCHVLRCARLSVVCEEEVISFGEAFFSAEDHQVVGSKACSAFQRIGLRAYGMCCAKLNSQKKWDVSLLNCVLSQNRGGTYAHAHTELSTTCGHSGDTDPIYVDGY